MGTVLPKRLALIVLAFFWSLPMWSQPTIQDRLNSVYKGKVLILRNFYSGNDLRYDEKGTLVSGGASGPWTLANVEITGFTVSAQEIEITATRVGILYWPGKQRFERIGKLKIRLAQSNAGSGGDAELDSVLSNIFIRPGEDLRSMLPDYWRYYLTGTDAPSRVSAWQDAVETSTGVPIRPGTRPGGLTAPKPVKTPDPKYTKEAASRHIEGRTTLEMVIDASGTPESIAIIEPLGMGLDEQAVAVLRTWKFLPSMSKDQAVPVPMRVEITFRCCP